MYASTLKRDPLLQRGQRMPHYRMRGSAGAIGPAPLQNRRESHVTGHPWDSYKSVGEVCRNCRHVNVHATAFQGMGKLLTSGKGLS